MTASLRSLAEKLDARRLATPDLVAEVLREAILSGRLRGGEFIRQDGVAAELAVSKIPVREALLRLEAEGLVRILRNRGAVVAELSLPDIREAFEIREALETLALDLAIPNLGPADFGRAERAIRDAEALDDMARLGRINWRFHEALTAPCGRPRLMATIRRLHVISDRYVRLHLLLTESRGRSEAEHRGLLEACRAKDRAAAAGLLRAHLTAAAERLIAHLEAKGFPGDPEPEAAPPGRRA